MSAASYATCRSAWSPVQRAHRPSRQFNSTHISCALSQRAESSGPEPSAVAAAHPHLLARLRATAGGVVLAAALALSPVGAHQAHAESVTISNDTPVVDLARVVPSARLEGLQQQLLDLEQQTGWRVRMLTRFGNEGPSVEEMRAGWSTDERTVVVLVDPSAPNIMNFKFGREVRQVLRPQFFTELQGRYGNMFNVREQGESAAVMSMMDALTGCLARGGCFAVPGLTGDHYAFTLAVSVAGGLIAGAASKLEPYGFVQRRWVWVALFAPLWGTLFINFGIGPVVSRTADLMPLLGNAAGFAAAAAAVGFSPQVARAAGLTTDEDSA